jgi:hypothetical protein
MVTVQDRKYGTHIVGCVNSIVKNGWRTGATALRPAAPFAEISRSFSISLCWINFLVDCVISSVSMS